MKPLEPPNSFHLSAAVGWLALGDPIQAAEELEKIDCGLRSHADVLEVRWQIYANAEKWNTCADIGNAIIELDPDRPFGWISRACALRRSADLGAGNLKCK